jgi:hypothetical protein
MWNYVWMILIVLCLTFVGVIIQGFLVLRYYWGERGTPPPNREERGRLREKELKMRNQRLSKKN